MKNILLFLLPLLLLAACAPSDPDALPADVEEKKNLLKTKKGELRDLQKFISNLEDSIAVQDPTFREVKRVLVRTIAVETKEFVRDVEIQGSVRANEVVNASAEMGGRILKLTVEDGDRVRRGQLLAVLDLKSLEKQKEELETSLSLAEDVYNRQKRLWDQNIGSEIQYLEAKNRKESLEKSIASLNHELSKSRVYAPSSGVVESVMAEAGEMTSPGQPLLQILDTRRVKVVADVPENFIGAVNKGKKVVIRIPALGIEKTERVSYIGSVVDPSNRTFEVEVEIPNAKSNIKPNLLATMAIEDYREPDAIFVPLSLVQQEVGGKDYVLVATGEGEELKAEKRYVKTGESSDDSIVILEGLKAGEQIITEGARGLADNTLVQLSSVNDK